MSLPGRRVASVLVVGVSILLTVVSIPAAATVAGTAAPAIDLRDGNGQVVRLADFKGKVVLLDFWATWCPPCKVSFPKLDALYKEWRERGLEVLAVNLDDRRRDADAFLTAHPHTMAVLFDPRGDAPRAFAVRGMPSSVLIDRSGTVRFTHMGYSEKVIESYRQELELLLGGR
jgi:thiol-disulfide isomerase/thioredoxin